MCFLAGYYGNTIMLRTSDGPNPPSPPNIGEGVSLFLGMVDCNLGIVPEGAWQVKYQLTIKTNGMVASFPGSPHVYISRSGEPGNEANRMVDLRKEIQFLGFLLIQFCSCTNYCWVNPIQEKSRYHKAFLASGEDLVPSCLQLSSLHILQAMKTESVSSLVPSLRTPPSKKRSGEWSWISLDYSQKVVRTNEIARVVINLPYNKYPYPFRVRLVQNVLKVARLHCRKSIQQTWLDSPGCFSLWEGGVWGRD